MQEQESCGPEAKHQGLVGAPSVHETTAMEEKTASSMPSILKSLLAYLTCFLLSVIFFF